MNILVTKIGTLYCASYFDGIIYAYGTGYTEAEARERCERQYQWLITPVKATPYVPC